jgi:hypothetical protein
MKMESRRSHDLPFFLAATLLLLAMLACNLPVQSNSPDQATPTHASGKSTPTNASSQATPTHASVQATPTSTQPDSAAQAACLAGIFPGTTSRDEVVALLGEPLAVEPEGDLEILLYASPLRGQFNSIVIQNQVVALVSIMVSEDNPLAWSAVKAQYGEPAQTTYSNYLQWSMTYIYPDQGLAFVAAQAPDVVFIQECFVPMPLEDYMNSWGKSLPVENPYIR